MGSGIVREKPALMTTTDVLTFGNFQQDQIILKSQNNGDGSQVYMNGIISLTAAKMAKMTTTLTMMMTLGENASGTGGERQDNGGKQTTALITLVITLIVAILQRL